MDSRTADIIGHSADPVRAKEDLRRFEEAYLAVAGRALDWERGAPLARIFGNSHALAGRLIANPAWADEISASPFASQRKPREMIDRELAEAIAAAGTEAVAFDRALRRFKYREMVRLVAQDLARTIGTREMLAEWSDIADALIGAAYTKAHATLMAKLGAPLKTNGSPCDGAIVALGKLGGAELNLSSDVDLLVLYDTDEGSATGPAGASTSIHEWYVKLAAEVTRLLATVTPDGFVFRVDHELRPEGPQGPLANALDAALRYYEYFGRDWERQAMIRARPAAGSEALGQAFVEGLRPFVYRRSLSIGDLAHMRETKAKMAAKAVRRTTGGRAFDIKVGGGGIRDVEFLVQALQQLHGGAHPAVRRANTFEAIEALAKAHLIHPYGARVLQESYAFLRRLENMIQVEDDLQTHRMPEDEAKLLALARRMGLEDRRATAKELGALLTRHTRSIARLFAALFEADYERLELEEAIEDNLSRATGEEEAADSLAWFKQGEMRRLAALDLEGATKLPALLKRITLVAEVVVACAFRMAQQQLVERHGEPRQEGGTRATFAIVGMGRLGSRELDYGSDLDLLFLFSGPGQTDGPRPIANVEFFTKFAQRIISLLSLPTRYGRAWQVDSELRPSGRSGTLVASLESFVDYHTHTAQIWERLSLLRARAIAGDEALVRGVRMALQTLAFRQVPPPEAAVREEIDRLRRRSIEERAGERPGLVNLKIGRGGLADLESVIQFRHLMSVADRETLWRQNTFEVIDALAAEGIIGGAAQEEWLDHVAFFRRLIARLRLVTGSSTDAIEASSSTATTLAQQLGFLAPGELMEEIDYRRAAVRKIYEEIIHC